jgi:thioredoxin reductase (NADPH)
MHDVAIIGAGPGGVTAGIYAVRYGLKAIVLSKEPGGWMAKTPTIENWPGEIKPIEGFELASRFVEHMKAYGAEFAEEEVDNVERTDQGFRIHTTTDNVYHAKALIFATGSKKRMLNVPGEEPFSGKGVSYCVTCDGPLFRGRQVGVSGGGDSAAEAAIMLAEYAKEVKLFVRDNEMSAKHYLQEKLKSLPNVKLMTGAFVTRILGDQLMHSVELNDGSVHELQGLFVEIGLVPMTELAAQLGIELQNGLIQVGPDMASSVPGVFGAGDITTGSNELRQIVTAAGEGAIAANSAFKYLRAR